MTAARLRVLLLLAATTTATATAGHVLYMYDIEQRTVGVLVYSPRSGFENSGSVNWLPDGSAIVFSAHPHFSEARLFRGEIVDRGIGDVTEIGVGNLPTLSPDGTDIIYAMMPGNPDDLPTGLYRRPLGGDGAPLGGGPPMAGNFPIWVTDDLLIGKNVAGLRGMSVIDLKADRAEPLSRRLTGRAVFGGPGVSRGRLVSLTVPVGEDGVASEDAADRRLDLLTPTAEGPFDVTTVMTAPEGRTFQWAAAGSQSHDDLYFVATRSEDGRLEVWRVPGGDAEKAEPLLRGWPDVGFGSLAPSPDGRFLVFRSNLQEVDGPDGEILTERDLIIAETGGG